MIVDTLRQFDRWLSGITESQVNLFTLWLVSVALPIVGVSKLFLAAVMVRNTHLRTPLGDWLVRMFVAIGAAFLLIGSVYLLAVLEVYGWLVLPVWARWEVRIAAVTAALLALFSTAALVRVLIPLLRDAAWPAARREPLGIAREIAIGFVIIFSTSAGLLGLLMLLVDWV